MKKFVLSSAMLAVSGFAAAQSSVTLFGTIDVALQRGSGSIASRTQLVSGATSTSNIGFRGVEDLGGGLSASFWLEAAVAADSGAGSPTSTNNQPSGTPASLGGAQGLTFNRRSTVSLAGPWGELRMGRDYSPAFYNRFRFDPWGNNGVGGSQVAAASPVSSINRVSNQVAYWLPAKLGGLYGVFAYQMGENPSNAGATKKDGSALGARLGWSAGPFDIAVAHQVTKYATTATAGDFTSTNIGGSYNFGTLTLMGGVYRDEVDRTVGLTGKGAQLGGIWSVGSGDVKAMYSHYKTNAAGNPEARKFSLGYAHKLSKRTLLYATYGHVRNSGGASFAVGGSTTGANQSSSGIDLGVKHTF